jgi:hypothetical protein
MYPLKKPEIHLMSDEPCEDDYVRAFDDTFCIAYNTRRSCRDGYGPDRSTRERDNNSSVYKISKNIQLGYEQDISWRSSWQASHIGQSGKALPSERMFLQEKKDSESDDVQ